MTGVDHFERKFQQEYGASPTNDSSMLEFVRYTNFVIIIIIIITRWSTQFGDVPEVLPTKQPFWDRECIAHCSPVTMGALPA